MKVPDQNIIIIVNNDKEEAPATIELTKSKMTVHGVKIGVLLSPENLTGDEYKDFEYAKTFLSQKHHFMFLEKGTIPGLIGTGYAFQSVVPEKIARE